MKRGENRSTRRKTSRSKGENQQQTQPTYGVHMAWTPGFEPRPHWWEASALTTASPLLPQYTPDLKRHILANTVGIGNTRRPCCNIFTPDYGYSYNIKVCVPRGSLFGPLLFYIFISDLNLFIPSMSLRFYADDTTGSYSHNCSCVLYFSFIK